MKDIETDYCPPPKVQCHAWTYFNIRCELTAGHGGPHIAHDPEGEIAWSRSPHAPQEPTG